jgi:hypothetical protein
VPDDATYTKSVPNDDPTRWTTTVDGVLLEMYDAARAATGDTDRLSDIVVVLHGLLATTKDTYKEACDLLASAMGDEPEVVSPSGPVLEKKNGTPRKTWRHTEIGRDVAHRLVEMNIDMDTGEVLLGTEDLMVAMLDYAAPSYWRVKQLSQLGLVADDYCEQGEPTTSIVVRSR